MKKTKTFYESTISRLPEVSCEYALIYQSHGLYFVRCYPLPTTRMVIENVYARVFPCIVYILVYCNYIIKYDSV